MKKFLLTQEDVNKIVLDLDKRVNNDTYHGLVTGLQEILKAGKEVDAKDIYIAAHDGYMAFLESRYGPQNETGKRDNEGKFRRTVNLFLFESISRTLGETGDEIFQDYAREVVTNDELMRELVKAVTERNMDILGIR